MQGTDQRAQLLLRDILQFVDEQNRRSLAFRSGFTDAFEQIGQIGLQIAAIGHAHDRLKIDIELHVLILELG